MLVSRMPALIGPPIFAHLGHWYISLPVFMGPVLVLAIALKLQSWRESRPLSDGSPKRAGVKVTSVGECTTVAVVGSLDYPALVDLEVKLGAVDSLGSELVLDLRDVTDADTESAWLLCDAVGRAYRSENVKALVGAAPALDAVRGAFVAEGISISSGREP